MASPVQVETARHNWRKASEELGFELITPFEILINNEEKMVFAYLPEYGSQNGAIVELDVGPEFKIHDRLFQWCKENDVFISIIKIESLIVYDVTFFREVLKDWKLPGAITQKQSKK